MLGVSLTNANGGIGYAPGPTPGTPSRSRGGRRDGSGQYPLAAHLLDVGASGQELLAFAEQTNDLLRRMPPSSRRHRSLFVPPHDAAGHLDWFPAYQE